MTEQQEFFERVGDQLRAKIMSKFQTSAFLAGLAVAVLGVQLTNLGDAVQPKPPLFAASISLMFGGLLLYVAALIKFDALTMPKRFWKADKNRAASDWTFVLLEDGDLRELHKRMVFFWYVFTIAATTMTALALLLLLVPKSWVPGIPEIGPEGTFKAVLYGVGLVVFYFFVLTAVTRGWLRPILNQEFNPLLRMQD